MHETLRTIGSLTELLLWRDGGQRQSRRNAWTAMAADTRRSRERAEVAAAVARLTTAAGDATVPLAR